MEAKPKRIFGRCSRPSRSMCPGQFYVTKRGVHIYAIPGDGPRGLSWFGDPKHSSVLAYLVEDREIKKNAKKYPIPPDYPVYVDAPAGKTGRPRRDVAYSSPWGREFTYSPELPDILVEHARRLGYYVVTCANYFRIGIREKSVLVIFKNGILGFADVERARRMAIRGVATKKHSTDAFYPYRMDLRDVRKQERTAKLIDLFIAELTASAAQI